MKLYLAARYDRREEMREIRVKLHLLGFVVTSRWLDETPETEAAVAAGDAQARRTTAEIDLVDIQAADALLIFQDEPGAPKSDGKHFEAGYAAGIDVPVISIGTGRPSIFYSLTYRADTLELALQILASLATPEQMLASFRRVLSKCRMIGENLNASQGERLAGLEYVMGRCAVYFAAAHHIRHG